MTADGTGRADGCRSTSSAQRWPAFWLRRSWRRRPTCRRPFIARCGQDVFAEAGTLLGARRRGTRLVGYLGHATLAALIACAYAGFFQLVGDDVLLGWGAVGGVVHFLVGGAVVGAMFPVVDEHVERPHPGFAYRHYGRRDVVTFLVGHLVFGAVLGLLYPLLHPSLEIAAAW